MYSGKGESTFFGQGEGGSIMKKLLDDFRKGVERIRWFAALFSERLKIEIATFKLLYESDRMAKTREEVLRKIGERVVDLKGNEEKNILKDSVVAEAIREIEKLDKSLDDLKGRVSDLGRVPD